MHVFNRRSLLLRSALVVLFCAALTPALAVVYVSNANGSWTTNSTWTPNGNPGAGDDVTINHAVTTPIVAARAITNITIGAAGSLTPGTLVTLTVNGNWANSGTFTPGSNGTVTFAGTGTQNITGANQTTFNNLTINKSSGSVVPGRNLTVSKTLTLTAGTFTLGTYVLTLGTNTASGTATINGGTFSVVGAGGRVTCFSTSYPYSFTVASGGTIHALNAQFDGMGTGGIYVNSGTVDATNNFSGCTFNHGATTGPMLRIENSQTLNNMTNVSFTGSAGNNIRKNTNSGHVTVGGTPGGTMWGSAYENDPNDIIDWLVAPGAFNLLTPANHATGVAIAGSMTWGASTGATSYDVYYDVFTPPTTLRGNVASPTYAYSGLANNTLHYWKVVAKNAGGNTPCNANFDFTTVVAVPTVNVTEPNGGEVMIPGSFFDITWNQGGGTATYDSIYYSTNSGSSWIGVARINAPTPVTYHWTPIPNTPTAQGRVKLVAYNAAARVEAISVGLFTIGTVDAGVTEILAPVGSADTSVQQTPRAKVKNFGTVQATGVQVTLKVDLFTGPPIYINTKTLNIAPGAESTVTFNPWPKPYVPQTYMTKCKAVLAADNDPTNDSLAGSFIVTATPPGWFAKSPMPAGAKALKDGGWLTYDASKGRIYAARGNKQPDFFSYFPAGDSWHALAPWPLGIEAKPPTKGSFGCADGSGHIYATKGNNKLGWWKYYATGDSWSQKEDVPLGLSNKKVKGGTGIAYAEKAGTWSPYLLKGYKNEFYRYETYDDTWQTLPPAPIGASVKWDKGSWLAYDNVNNMIYAFKGRYHEFYRYDPEGDSWGKALTPMPTAGSAGSKKAKDGSCAAYMNGFIYAFKGGNTREFWQYTIATNSWAEKETIPTGLLKKKVKAGAGMAAVGAVLYATKGNKSNELWKYASGGSLFDAPRHDGVVAGKTVIAQGMSISPNPLVGGFAVLRYSLPKAGAAELSVYNVAGQSVMARTLVAGRSGNVDLDLRYLSNGVYLVKFSSEGFASSQKLVVQR